jgi:hypothetical protein
MFETSLVHNGAPSWITWSKQAAQWIYLFLQTKSYVTYLFLQQNLIFEGV